MNILFVSDVSIAKVIGGTERVLFEQSTRLAQREHKVHILTRRLPDHRQNQEVIQNVTEWRYDLDNKSTAAFIMTTRKTGNRLFEFLYGTYFFDDPKFLFKDTTPEAMAALIAANYREFKTCPQESKDNSRRCRRFVERYYSWEKNVDSLEAILY